MLTTTPLSSYAGFQLLRGEQKLFYRYFQSSYELVSYFPTYISPCFTILIYLPSFFLMVKFGLLTISGRRLYKK